MGIDLHKVKMSQAIQQQIKGLGQHEKAELQKLAKQSGMTVNEWIEYSQKAQIYHNAEERLSLKPAA